MCMLSIIIQDFVCSGMFYMYMYIIAKNTEGPYFQIRAHIYEGHLESSGNSEISRSQKQNPIHFSYQCKGLYLFFQTTILSTYFITFVQSDHPLLRYTVCIVKFTTFIIFLIILILKNTSFVQIDRRKQICFALL